MQTFEGYAESVVFKNRKRRSIRVESFHEDLEHIGTGRSALVFKIKQSNKVIKVFPERFQHIAIEEATIYKKLTHIAFFSRVYDTGKNYIVLDFIEGETLFECLNKGIKIEEQQVLTIDRVLKSAREAGLNPSDIHLRNIILTKDKGIKIIDVARFRQKKDCRMWKDLKRAYFQYYLKPYFPRKIPKIILHLVALLYKKNILAFRKPDKTGMI